MKMRLNTIWLLLVTVLVIGLIVFFYLRANFNQYHTNINDPRVTNQILDYANQILLDREDVSDTYVISNSDFEFLENELVLKFYYPNDSVLNCIEINSDTISTVNRIEYNLMDFITGKSVLMETFKKDEQIFYDPVNADGAPPFPGER